MFTKIIQSVRNVFKRRTDPDEIVYEELIKLLQAPEELSKQAMVLTLEPMEENQEMKHEPLVLSRSEQMQRLYDIWVLTQDRVDLEALIVFKKGTKKSFSALGLLPEEIENINSAKE